MSKVQNKQIQLRIRAEQVKSAVRQAEVEDGSVEKANEPDTRHGTIDSNSKQAGDDTTLSECELISSKALLKKQMGEQLTRLANQLNFRRRLMIYDLYRIYFVEDRLIRLFKRQCTCTKFDLIRGLHLPPAKLLAGNLALIARQPSVIKDTEKWKSMQLSDTSLICWTV
jgi:hypothetical protein